MRILVSADIHLGSPIRSVALRNPELGERLKQVGRDSFVQIINLAIEESVDALVLAGDIFDNDYPDMRSRFFLMAQLTRASAAGVQTMLIRGNHDALLDHQKFGDLGKNIHMLHKGNPTVELGGTAFHGLSFDKAHVNKSFLPDFPRPLAGSRNVGVMHTSLNGSPGHDPYAPCPERDLMAHGFDLWCLGHIHTPFERVDGSTLAVMPGIPQPRHFGERDGGSVTLVTLDQSPPVFERRSVGRLRFSECEPDLSACADQQEVIRNLRMALSDAQDTECDTAVRLSVTTDKYAAVQLSELAEEILEDIDGVFLDKVKSRLPSQKPDAGALDLVRLMREELTAEGFRHLASEQLEELRTALPSIIRDELDDEELDTLLEEAVSEVALNLRMGVTQ